MTSVTVKNGFVHYTSMTSLTNASNDVTPVRAGFWNDKEATRPDSRWGILDDKKKKINIWPYIDDIKEWENAKKHKTKQNKKHL